MYEVTNDDEGPTTGGRILSLCRPPASLFCCRGHAILVFFGRKEKTRGLDYGILAELLPVVQTGRRIKYREADDGEGIAVATLFGPRRVVDGTDCDIRMRGECDDFPSCPVLALLTFLRLHAFVPSCLRA